MENWWVQLLGIVVSLVLTLLAIGARRFSKWLIARADFNDAEKEALQCLLDGMSLAQESLVREAKMAASDGKLTKEEIKKAETIALEYAKKAAEGPALDIIKSWSERRVTALIKQLLSKLKGKKDASNTSNTDTNTETTT